MAAARVIMVPRVEDFSRWAPGGRFTVRPEAPCSNVPADSAAEELVFGIEDFEADDATIEPIDNETRHIRSTVQRLLAPSSDGVAIHSAAHEAVAASGDDLQAAAAALQRMGWSVKVHRSPGGSLRQLRHTYLTATRNTLLRGERAEWVIDPAFSQAFHVADPTPRYAHVLSAVPPLVVAPLGRLLRAVLLLSAELERNFERRGMPLPPWRSSDAMASRYDQAAAAAPAAKASAGGAAAARQQARAAEQLERVQLRLLKLGVQPVAVEEASPAGGSPASPQAVLAGPDSPTSVVEATQALLSRAFPSGAKAHERGTSVTDLEDRVQSIEKRVSDDLQALWPLREVDVQGELTAARASIDKLSRQVALLERDQEEARIQAEKRLQQVEARQAEAERQLAALAGVVEAAAAESAASVDELRGVTKAMLGEFVSRIADQFDALQAALDEAIGGRAGEAEERAAAAAAVASSLEAQRVWVDGRVDALAAQVEAAVEASQAAAAAAADERTQRAVAAAEVAQQEAAGLRADLQAAQAAAGQQRERQDTLGLQVEQQRQRLSEVAAAQEEQAAALQGMQEALQAVQDSAAADAEHATTAAGQALAGLQQRVDDLAAQQGAAAQRQADAEGLLRQALAVWQRGLEEQMAALEGRLAAQAAAAAAQQQQLAGKFEEYRGYVKRLRREVAEARAEQEAAKQQIGAVRHEFGATHERLGQAQAEAAALGSELLQSTAAAAAAGTALRQLSIRT